MPTRLVCPNCQHDPLRADTRSNDAWCAWCGAARPPKGWPEDPYVGRYINGKYEITDKVGEGGYGVVVRGRHMEGDVCLGDVVLKFLHPHLANDAAARQRFIDEVRVARSLDSPHVVKIFDFGFDEHGQPFIVMEHLVGTPLAALVDEPLPPPRAMSIGLQLANSLDECHRRGVLHLDLKPDNVFLLPDGDRDFVKIIDFGIARVPNAKESQSIRGTPLYMAPEQAMGHSIDSGADIYALGVMLFQCLCGRHPIAVPTETSSPIALLQSALTQQPTPLRKYAPDLPQSLEALLGKMLAKERVKRPPSMGDIGARLRAIAAQQGWLADYRERVTSGVGTRTHASLTVPVKRQRRTLRLLVLALVAAGVVATVGFLQRPTPPAPKTDHQVVQPPKSPPITQPALSQPSLRPDAQPLTDATHIPEPDASARRNPRAPSSTRQRAPEGIKDAGVRLRPSSIQPQPPVSPEPTRHMVPTPVKPLAPTPEPLENRSYPEEKGGL